MFTKTLDYIQQELETLRIYLREMKAQDEIEGVRITEVLFHVEQAIWEIEAEYITPD